MKIETVVRYLLFTLLIHLLAANFTFAECTAENAAILHARYKEGDTRIFVTLSKRVNEADLSYTGKPGQWRLSDLTSLGTITIKDVKPEYVIAGETTSIIIYLDMPLNVDHDYRLQAEELTFLGCPTKDDEHPDVIVQKKKNPKTVAAPQTQPAKKKNYFPMDAADDRNASNVYLSGSIDGARGGKPDFSTDMKIEIPFVLKAGTYNPKTNQRGHEIDVRPYFNLKTSSAKNGDADSMNFGGKFRIPFRESKSGVLRYLLWEPAGGFESDRRFRNVNLITAQMLTFGVRGNKHTFKRRIRVLPFIGYEGGQNLKSPVKAAEGRTISRGVVGSTMYINFDRAEDSSFSFQIDYTRRFLLNREVSFKEDDNKKLVPLFLGKGPRDYLKATAEYDFSKFTGITLSYEYGRLPPNYELVNHKYSLGLVFKFTTKFSGK